MTESDIFVFGDSLSDTGNLFALTSLLSGGSFAIPPAPFYFNGRASNGPVAIEQLAAKDPNLTLNPTNNFAVAGARTGQGNSFEDDLGGVDLPGLRDQINAFGTKVGLGNADKNGLYLVWAGPNDFLDYLGGLSFEDPAALIATGAANITYAATALKTLGAEKIVLPNMANLGQLPFSRGLHVEVEGTALTKAFNAAVALQLGNLNFAVTEVDMFTAVENVRKNPTSFGFTNITDQLLPLQFSPTPPSNPEQYFFWDQFHPTAQGHEVLADVIDRTITGNIPQLSFNKIVGTSNNDFRVGTSANDDMRGLAGNDILHGRKGDDRLQGGDGNDKLFGDRGDDILSGDNGADSLWGGQGNDICFGGSGDDQLFGDKGDDILIGDDGNDCLQGGSGNDYLLGGSGQDRLWGDVGQDLLNGGSDNDKLYGGADADTLVGSFGADLLSGGCGADKFVLKTLGESLLSGFDRILDLNIQHDSLDGPTPVNAAALAELGRVKTLIQADISAVLTRNKFLAGGAATFTVGSGCAVRTFLALNDTVAGFQQDNDAILEITGFCGKLTDLAIF